MRVDGNSVDVWQEFVTEIESSIGKRETVREWWEDRASQRKLINHMIGAMGALARMHRFPVMSREEVISAIECYLMG